MYDEWGWHTIILTFQLSLIKKGINFITRIIDSPLPESLDLSRSFRAPFTSIDGSSGCLACYREPKPTETLKDHPPFSSRAKTFKKPNVSEDFWSTSTVDMDNTTFPSQGSISSSNQTFDSQSGAAAPPEFVNQGLLLWNQTRERWVGKERRSNNPPDPTQGAKINWDAASYDSLLGSNKLFSQPIPLNEMVDFLVEVWEQEGLYD
ncbi:hypothetical protein HID58_030863 [Brassica napus]|uniref:(rape) hypothetical protein n=1 Tax=Brassica napus TaxID=3708 RepID=A0A817AFU6_BRANA|nr:hypothetical protein HID58_030863 [Brassica napus]CAF2258419.1 unnamed protein product [Brassica napus]